MVEIIEEYFKGGKDLISFIELKNELRIGEDFILTTDIPLPLTIDYLKELVSQEDSDRIDFVKVLEGMILSLGIDIDFPYNYEYLQVLKEAGQDLEGLALEKGLEYRKQEDLLRSGLYFRGGLVINEEKTSLLLNYSLVLEEIGRKSLDEGGNKAAEVFIDQARKILEKIVSLEPENSLAYYKLGYHYKYLGEFLKAKLNWEKLLKIEKREEILSEVREELYLIEDQVNLELGIIYLENKDFNRAEKYFLKLYKKNSDWWEINYFLGNTYLESGRFEEARDFLARSLELNNKDARIYNDYGISLYQLNNPKAALEIFSKGLEVEKDYRLFYNRGHIYLELGELDKAYEDIVEASKLNKEDPNLKEEKKRLEEILFKPI